MAEPRRLYLWTRPRSLGFHFLFVLVAGGCVIAMWWQIQRAAQGNVLSYLYSVEWPVIAIVVGIGWWQLVHDTPDDIARRREFHRRMRAASAEVVARTLPRSARALTVDSEEVSGRALEGPKSRAVTAGSAPADGGTTLVPSGQPLTLRNESELEGRLLGPDGGAENGQADEMTEYNRYLAVLAVKGRPKTWRNPRGL